MENVKQIFVSHTKKDADFCDQFDVTCARVGIRAFRSEFENIGAPPYKTIMNAMNNSVALFLLVGKELVKSQETGSQEWEYTQNWIAFEIGLACQKGIDVWAVCDSIGINFPMPYLNNYSTVTLKSAVAFGYMKYVLGEYAQGRTFAYPYQANGIHCPYEDCRMEFNYHVKWKAGDEIPCPHCLKSMSFKTDRAL